MPLTIVIIDKIRVDITAIIKDNSFLLFYYYTQPNSLDKVYKEGDNSCIKIILVKLSLLYNQ